jgi:hypothetical protein
VPFPVISSSTVLGVPWRMPSFYRSLDRFHTVDGDFYRPANLALITDAAFSLARYLSTASTPAEQCEEGQSSRTYVAICGARELREHIVVGVQGRRGDSWRTVSRSGLKP